MLMNLSAVYFTNKHHALSSMAALSSCCSLSNLLQCHALTTLSLLTSSMNYLHSATHRLRAPNNRVPSVCSTSTRSVCAVQCAARRKSVLQRVSRATGRSGDKSNVGTATTPAFKQLHHTSASKAVKDIKGVNPVPCNDYNKHGMCSNLANSRQQKLAYNSYSSTQQYNRGGAINSKCQAMLLSEEERLKIYKECGCTGECLTLTVQRNGIAVLTPQQIREFTSRPGFYEICFFLEGVSQCTPVYGGQADNLGERTASYFRKWLKEILCQGCDDAANKQQAGGKPGGSFVCLSKKVSPKSVACVEAAAKGLSVVIKYYPVSEYADPAVVEGRILGCVKYALNTSQNGDVQPIKLLMFEGTLLSLSDLPVVNTSWHQALAACWESELGQLPNKPAFPSKTATYQQQSPDHPAPHSAFVVAFSELSLGGSSSGNLAQGGAQLSVNSGWRLWTVLVQRADDGCEHAQIICIFLKNLKMAAVKEALKMLGGRAGGNITELKERLLMKMCQNVLLAKQSRLLDGMQHPVVAAALATQPTSSGSNDSASISPSAINLLAIIADMQQNLASLMQDGPNLQPAAAAVAPADASALHQRKLNAQIMLAMC